MQEKLTQRQVEIDVIKAVAILAVVLIHSISLSFQYFIRGQGNWQLLIIIDQLTRFSVPMFVALSGFGLGIKNMEMGWKYGEFLKRRVVKLLPWYLFWSGVIYFYIRTSTEWQYVEHFPVWKIIFLGKADYHLYFVPMIVSLYLLFPVLAFLIRRMGWKIVVLFGLMQAVLYLFTSLEAEKIISLDFAWGDQQQYLFFGSWIFYFVLGIYLNFLPGVLKKGKFIMKLLAVVMLFGGFGLIVLDTLRLVGDGADVIAATRFTRLPVMVFASGFILSSLIWRKFWLKFPEIFVWLGERSFMVYLSHTIVIREVLNVFKPRSMVELLMFFVVVVMLSTVLAEIMHQLSILLKKTYSWKH